MYHIHRKKKTNHNGQIPGKAFYGDLKAIKIFLKLLKLELEVSLFLGKLPTQLDGFTWIQSLLSHYPRDSSASTDSLISFFKVGQNIR